MKAFDTLLSDSRRYYRKLFLRILTASEALARTLRDHLELSPILSTVSVTVSEGATPCLYVTRSDFRSRFYYEWGDPLYCPLPLLVRRFWLLKIAVAWHSRLRTIDAQVLQSGGSKFCIPWCFDIASVDGVDPAESFVAFRFLWFSSG